MKKTTTIILTVALAIGSLSFTSIKSDKKSVDVEKSKVVWKGYKVTGSHAGTIALKEGALEFDNGALVGGNFTVDMTTIVCTDKEGGLPRLEGHLKSDDFFGVENHPTATLVFTSVTSKGKNSYTVTADLTIKGKTNPVTFDFSVYGNQANASLKVDRSLYDVRYGSGSFFDNLGDKTIYDEFDLVVDLVF